MFRDLMLMLKSSVAGATLFAMPLRFVVLVSVWFVMSTLCISMIGATATASRLALVVAEQLRFLLMLLFSPLSPHLG